MSFEEVSLNARNFAIQQGFTNLFLELENGELGSDGRWHITFLQTAYNPTRVEVVVDDSTGKVTGFKRLPADGRL